MFYKGGLGKRFALIFLHVLEKSVFYGRDFSFWHPGTEDLNIEPNTACPVVAMAKTEDWAKGDVFQRSRFGGHSGGDYILTLDRIKDYIKQSYHEVQDWITRQF